METHTGAASPGSVRHRLVPALCLALSLAPALAQEPPPESDDVVVNHAFASQLGSGIYEISGRYVQVYRLPLSWKLRDGEDDGISVRLRLPVTLGFYDLESSDVAESDRSDDLATFTFIPGVVVGFRVRDSWTLSPFLDFGVAREMDIRQDSYVYAFGLESLATFEVDQHHLRLANRLVYSGQHTPGQEVDNDFALLETGFSHGHRLPLIIGGREVVGTWFAIGYLFIEPTEIWIRHGPMQVGAQLEIGVTLNLYPPPQAWKMKLPALGMSYRFGDGVSAIRLVLGKAF